MQCICLSFYSFDGRKNKWWAFTQMGLAAEALDNIPGLSFYKLMGTGAGKGFRPWPDLGTYALLTVWDDSLSAEKAFKQAKILMDFKTTSSHIQSFWLSALRGHGQWNGKSPFLIEEQKPQPNKDERVAVITRASIKKRWMLYFWWRVRKVSRRVHQMADLEMAKGIGEWPLLEQATFSIWKNAKAIDQYAYRGQEHKNVVKATRKIKWYAEEMFMRFNIIEEQSGQPGPPTIY
jgi:heme-degrading monooxygenase HmoA